MNKTLQTLLLAVALIGFSFPPAHAGDALAVTVDGLFREWRGVPLAAVDPAADGRVGGIDLRRVWLANDAEALYLRLNVGRETILQNSLDEAIGHHLRLYLDTDARASTGKPVGGLGVEVEVRFGERQVVVYQPSGIGELRTPSAGGIRSLPTHSAAVFELRVPFHTARLPGRVRLFLEEEAPGGDRMPQQAAITYVPSRQAVAAPVAIDLGRRDEAHVRLVSLNVEDSLLTTRKALYQRYLGAIAPDILNFQSLTAWGGARTRLYVANVLPHPEGGSWSVAEQADCITVSAYPILAHAAVDNNLLVYIDLPDERTSRDLVLFNVHLPCCENDAGRDTESTNLVRLWRDLVAGVGPFPIDPDDAVIVTGDFNYVGFRRQVEAVQGGMGRGESPLVSAPLRHSHARSVVTWRRARSPFAPGKLDYVFFSNDVLRLENNYVLDTATMPAEELRRQRLRRGDSLLVSDHLALVTDFSFRF